MADTSHRLSILSAQEIDDLYGLPRFTPEERYLYFDFSRDEREAVKAVHTISTAVHLALQLGYFKAKCQFFVYEQEAVREDLLYLLERYFPGRIKLVPLPGYAPEVNPQEGIWQYLKYKELKNLACVNLTQLRGELIQAIKRLRYKHKVIRACFAQAEQCSQT